MPLDFMFRIHLMTLLENYFVMLLELICMKNNDIIF